MHRVRCPRSRPAVTTSALTLSPPVSPILLPLLFRLLPSLSLTAGAPEALLLVLGLLTRATRPWAPLGPWDRKELLALLCSQVQGRDREGGPDSSPITCLSLPTLPSRSLCPECGSCRSCLQTTWELLLLHSPGESCCSQAETMYPTLSLAPLRPPRPTSVLYLQSDSHLLEHSLLSPFTAVEHAALSAWNTSLPPLRSAPPAGSAPCSAQPCRPWTHRDGRTVPLSTCTWLSPPFDVWFLNERVFIFNFWVPTTWHRAWHELDF